MKYLVAALAAAQTVAGHALFQQLWVDGKDMISGSRPRAVDNSVS